MKPIELVVVVNNIRDIFLFRLAASLEPYPIHVRVALDSRRACQMLAAKRHQPDLVILDLDLKSSLSVLESTNPYVPVVVFTSLPTVSDRRTAFELGVVDYIEKPTNPTEFVEAVSQTVRQWAAEPVHDR
jgi:DNA-binding response OmpR family regulator